MIFMQKIQIACTFFKILPGVTPLNPFLCRYPELGPLPRKAWLRAWVVLSTVSTYVYVPTHGHCAPAPPRNGLAWWVRTDARTLCTRTAKKWLSLVVSFLHERSSAKSLTLMSMRGELEQLDNFNWFCIKILRKNMDAKVSDISR